MQRDRAKTKHQWLSPSLGFLLSLSKPFVSALILFCLQLEYRAPPPASNGIKFYGEQFSHPQVSSSIGSKVKASLSQGEYSSVWNVSIVTGKVGGLVRNRCRYQLKMGFKHWKNLDLHMFASHLGDLVVLTESSVKATSKHRLLSSPKSLGLHTMREDTR